MVRYKIFYEAALLRHIHNDSMYIPQIWRLHHTYGGRGEGVYGNNYIMQPPVSLDCLMCKMQRNAIANFTNVKYADMRICEHFSVIQAALNLNIRTLIR